MAGDDPPLTEESSQRDLLAEVIKLRAERDKNKVLYKGSCPSLDDASYDVWKRQWKNWRNQTCLTPGQQAHATMAVISDENKHKKGLSTLMWRQMADEGKDELTCDEVEKFLDEQFAVDSYEDTFNAWRAFITTVIRPNESYPDFTLRWRNAWLVLQRKDKNIRMSVSILVNILRDAAALDEPTVRALRAAVQLEKAGPTGEMQENKEALSETIKVINSICAGQKAKAPTQQQVKLVTAMGTADVQYDGQCFWVNGDKMIPTAEHDILVAEAKKKFGKNAKKKQEEAKKKKDKEADKSKDAERLKHIKCYGCGEFGHYKTNCPKETEDHESNLVQENIEVTARELDDLLFRQGCLEVEEDLSFSDDELQEIIRARQAEDGEEDEEEGEDEVFIQTPPETRGGVSRSSTRLELPSLVDMDATESEDEEEEEMSASGPVLSHLKPSTSSGPDSSEDGERGQEEDGGNQRPRQVRDTALHPAQTYENHYNGEPPAEDCGAEFETWSTSSRRQETQWRPEENLLNEDNRAPQPVAGAGRIPRQPGDPYWVEEDGTFRDPEGIYDGFDELMEQRAAMEPGWRPTSGTHTVDSDRDNNRTVNNWLERQIFQLPDPASIVPRDPEDQHWPAPLRRVRVYASDLEQLFVGEDGGDGDQDLEDCLVIGHMSISRSASPCHRGDQDEDRNDQGGARGFPFHPLDIFADEARGAAGLDSACSKTIMGMAWYEDYKSRLIQKFRNQIQGPVSSNTRIVFGGGGSKNSMGRYRIPLELHGGICKVVVEMVDANIPLMLSRATMSEARMKLDFQFHTTTVLGATRAMEETTTGHVIIRVMPSEHPAASHPVLMVEDWDEINTDGRVASNSSMDRETASFRAAGETSAGRAAAETSTSGADRQIFIRNRKDRKYFQHVKKKKEDRLEKRKQVQCFECGETGHYKSECPEKNSGRVVVQYARFAETSGETDEDPEETNTDHGQTGYAPGEEDQIRFMESLWEFHLTLVAAAEGDSDEPQGERPKTRDLERAPIHQLRALIHKLRTVVQDGHFNPDDLSRPMTTQALRRLSQLLNKSEAQLRTLEDREVDLPPYQAWSSNQFHTGGRGDGPDGAQGEKSRGADSSGEYAQPGNILERSVTPTLEEDTGTEMAAENEEINLKEEDGPREESQQAENEPIGESQQMEVSDVGEDTEENQPAEQPDSSQIIRLRPKLKRRQKTHTTSGQGEMTTEDMEVVPDITIETDAGQVSEMKELEGIKQTPGHIQTEEHPGGGGGSQ